MHSRLSSNLIKTHIKNCIADLILVQEIDSIKTLKELCKEYPAYNFHNTGKEAGILWNTRKFSDEKLGKDFDSVKKQHEQRNLEEESGIFSRLSVLLLTTKTSDGTDTSLVDEFSVANRSFLACSWHEPHIVKDEKKKKTSSEFQQIMTNFSTLKEVPFIVGGDFNLNTSKIELQCGIKSPGYEQSLRSKQFAEKSQKFIEYKDNFMLINTDMNIEWVRPIEFLKMKSNSDSDSETKPHDLSLEEHEKMEDLSKEFENIYDIFDHDPIMGILSLR